MTAPEDPTNFSEGEVEVDPATYIPQVVRRRVEDINVDEALPVQVDLTLPALPPGLSRRDRKEWRINTARHLADLQDQQRRANPDEWAGGFAHRPGIRDARRLGRAGRREYVSADRENRRQWWRSRRSQDLDSRGMGVLVVVLILGAIFLGRIIFTDDTPTDTGQAPTTPGVSNQGSATRSQVLPPVSTTVPGVPVAPGPTGDTGAAATAPERGNPTPIQRNPAGWQPAPSDGVATMATPAAATVDPASFAPVAPPTGLPTAAELSTPDGAVAAWFARICPSSWDEPFGSRLTRYQDLMSPAGWAVANPTRDTAGVADWAAAVTNEETRVCGQIHTEVSTNVPPADGSTVVYYTADRLITSGTGAFVPRLETVAGSIAAAQDTTAGPWRVGVAVTAG